LKISFFLSFFLYLFHSNCSKIIPKTDWVLAITTARNEFFYNLNSRLSIWHVPPEISKIIDDLIQEANDMRVNGKRARSDVTDHGVENIDKKSKFDVFEYNEVQDEQDEEETDEDEESDEETDEESEEEDMNKKDVQVEKNGQVMETNESTTNVETTAKSMTVPQQQQQQNEELEPEERIAKFISLLRDKDINPLSLWEKELPKIINDPRYMGK